VSAPPPPATTPRPRKRPAARRRVRPTIQRLLDQLVSPAYLRNQRFDILACNELGRALYAPIYEYAEAHTPGQPPNTARFTFSDLIGELSTRSEEFRRLWAAQDVRYHRSGRKRLHHPLVGVLELDYEALELPGDPGQRLNVYSAPPDSDAERALSLLASWTLTPSDDEVPA